MDLQEEAAGSWNKMMSLEASLFALFTKYYLGEQIKDYKMREM
jgi:hypothetical protein